MFNRGVAVLIINLLCMLVGAEHNLGDGKLQVIKHFTIIGTNVVKVVHL